MLVEFLINNCSEIFEEDIVFPACALAEESSWEADREVIHSKSGHVLLSSFGFVS